MRRQLVIVLAACALLVAVLAAGLRPDSFYVGDPGVKLISARNALRFPTHPLNIPLPTIGSDPTPHVEGFFSVHGDHSHAVTSEVFPLITAPLLDVFGLRGLYVLPAIGFIATLAAIAWLAVVLDRRRNPALVAIVVALGTPFLFYGLEFWEHTLALACGVSGTALLLDAARRRPGQHSATGRTLAAGVLSGAGILLRPETACFVVASMLATRTLVHRPTWRSIGVAAFGAALVMLPLEIYTIVHLGSFVPGHIGTNAAVVEDSWALRRVALATNWLLPSLWNSAGPLRASSFWSVAPAAFVGVAALVRRPQRDGHSFLWITAATTVALIVLMAPNDGGGQWGPRYLLFAYVPLALLAADGAQQLRRGALTVVVVALVLASCLWIQRASYRQLRGTKATYGRIVDFVGMNTKAGEYVVTDVWWLDQLAAAALDGRTLLYAEDVDAGHGILRRLNNAAVPAITVIRSREETPSIDTWADGTCYVETRRDDLSVRGVVAIQLDRRCAQPH